MIPLEDLACIHVRKPRLFSDPKYVNGCLVASVARGNECFSTQACGSVVPIGVPLRGPETSREVRIRAASAEVAGFEVVSEPFTVGLINLRGCLGGVGSPITAPHAATLLGESCCCCWLKANCSSVELAYVAAGAWAAFLIS